MVRSGASGGASLNQLISFDVKSFRSCTNGIEVGGKKFRYMQRGGIQDFVFPRGDRIFCIPYENGTNMMWDNLSCKLYATALYSALSAVHNYCPEIFNNIGVLLDDLSMSLKNDSGMGIKWSTSGQKFNDLMVGCNFDIDLTDTTAIRGVQSVGDYFEGTHFISSFESEGGFCKGVDALRFAEYLVQKALIKNDDLMDRISKMLLCFQGVFEMYGLEMFCNNTTVGWLDMSQWVQFNSIKSGEGKKVAVKMCSGVGRDFVVDGKDSIFGVLGRHSHLLNVCRYTHSGRGIRLLTTLPFLLRFIMMQSLYIVVFNKKFHTVVVDTRAFGDLKSEIVRERGTGGNISSYGGRLTLEQLVVLRAFNRFVQSVDNAVVVYVGIDEGDIKFIGGTKSRGSIKLDVLYDDWEN